VDPVLREELIRDEGLRFVAYQDSLGYWSIGVGHLLGDLPVPPTCTLEQADAWLEADVAAAEKVVARAAVVALDPVRHRALVNMAFNLGNRLTRFKRFLSALNAQEWERAGAEMIRSRWAKQVGARATRLRGMIVTGLAP